MSEESHVGRKNATKGKREVFAISSYHEFIWKKERKGCVQALPYIGGLETKHFQFAFGAQISLPNYVAYTLRQPISRDKVRDLSSLLPYIPEEKSELFQDIISSWPTKESKGQAKATEM